MDTKKEGYFRVPAVTPTGAATEFFVSSHLVEEIKNAGNSVQYYDLYSAGEVVMQPGRIFKGLKRNGCDSAFCYVGCPRRFDGRHPHPAPEGFVFAVYVQDHCVFEIGWEEADAADSSCPKGWKTRFDGPVK